MTVLDLLRTAIADRPDATLIIAPRDEGPASTFTRAEFGELAASIARQLREHGVGEGDCIAVWLPNWPVAFAAQFAACAIGAHVIGINTRYNTAEVGHVVRHARPKVILIAHGFVGLDLLSRIRAAYDASAESDDWCDPQLVPITGPGAPPADVSTYDVGGGAWILDATAGESLDDFAAIEDNPLAVAFTTSGSTGLPKLAGHDDYGVTQHAHATASAMGVTERDVLVCALPFSGTFGFTAAMGALAGGAVLLMLPSYRPAELAHLIPEHSVSMLAFGDDMLAGLRSAWQTSDADFSTLRWVGIAEFVGVVGEVAPWLESFGAHATGVYGSSEVFALSSMWPTSEPAPRRWSGGGRLVGAEMSYRIVDDAGEVVTDREGELQFRGPNVVTSYLGQPEKLADNVTPDGWLKSGDLGRAIDGRTFSYVCRMSDALRLKGFLVEPDEVALHLATHPAVDVAKVVGVSTGTGTVAVGFVTVRADATVEEGELVNYCAQSLAKFKVPAAVYIVDEMPTTQSANGTKIKAVTLREWAAERLGS